MYEVYPKSFRTGCLERELQAVQLCATRYSWISILWVSLASFAAITLWVASQSVYYYCCCWFRYRLSPETFGYTRVYRETSEDETFPSSGGLNNRIDGEFDKYVQELW